MIPSHFRLPLALLASLAIAACADAPPVESVPELIPRDVLFGNPDRMSPAISPDGKLLAYIAPDSGVLNIWVRTIGATDDRVITSDRKRGIRGFMWQADGQHILYPQDEGGDENFHGYQVNVATRKTRDLTPFRNVQTQIVAVDVNHPNEMLVAVNNRDASLHDVLRVNLTTGASTLDTRNPGDVMGWTADNNMVVRAAQVMLPDGGTEIRIRDSADSPWRSFLKWGADESFGGIAAFSPDNKSLYLISSVDANAAGLYEVDIATGSKKPIAVDSIYDVNSVTTHPVTHKLEAVEFIRDRSQWQIIDQSLKPDFDAISNIRDAEFSVVSRDTADKTWIVAVVPDDGPVSFYSYDRASKQPTLLFSARPALDKYKLAKMKPVSFTARDGMKIHGYLTLPVGFAPKNLPMVLNVHGGPWGRDMWGFDREVQWMANRGYAVLQVNYRGSTGYGKQYLNAGDREWAGKMHDDLIDAKRWAVSEGYADSSRVAIYGGSYGGYATLVGLTFTPDEFVAGVDIVGPSNLNTLLASIPPYWAPMKALFTKRMGENEEFLNSRSPLSRVDQIKKPLFIAQGANDPRVKQAESDQIVAAMRKSNIPVQYVVYEDEGHGFARPQNNMHFYGLAEEFLAKHLGGRAEPVVPVPGTSGVIR